MVEPVTKRLEIKKYANRRYYDTTHSRHLTLDEIRTLVHQGYDLTVLDAKTSADITAQVLTHIILELDTSKLDSLPVPLLVRIIRMNDQLVKDFIEKYFNQALQSFLNYQQHFEEQLRRAQGLPETFPSVSAWTKAMLQPFTQAFSTSTGNVAGQATRESSTESSDVRDLIRELRQEVAALRKGRPRKTRKSASRRRRSRGT